MTTIMDPTDERVPIAREVSARPQEIMGSLALLDISKPRGNVLLDRLEELLHERLPRSPSTATPNRPSRSPHRRRYGRTSRTTTTS